MIYVPGNYEFYGGRPQAVAEGSRSTPHAPPPTVTRGGPIRQRRGAVQTWDVLIFFPRNRRVLHVPVLLSLSVLAAVPVAVASAREGGSFRGVLMSLLVFGLAFFTLAHYRLLGADTRSFTVGTVLGRRALPLDRVAFRISASRSSHGLPLYTVHAEADGRRLTLSDSFSRQRAEQHLRRLQELLLGGRTVDEAGPSPSEAAPPGASPVGPVGARPLGGGRGWMVACVLGLLLAVLIAVGNWLAAPG